VPLLDAWGLRRRDGTPRQGSDIAPHRLLVRVRQGQGGKDRVVPLGERTRERWRASGTSARPQPWLFPARHEPLPLPPATLQQTVTLVGRQRGLAHDASLPTLRQAYATQLLACGSAWRVSQARLGHQSPRTTARDTPRTAKPCDGGPATINALLADLSTRRSLGRPEMAAVLPLSGRDSRQRFGQDRLPRQRRALAAMLPGRTEAVGGPRWPCEHGGQAPDVSHSGRHRSGPTGP
jgi:hypothetical protein